MYCTNCGEPMNDNQSVCLKCGFEKGKGKSFCSNCGKPVDPNADVCTSCGVKLTGGYLGGKDKVTMAIICFFLGSIGIHNFMMGEKKKGIVKIIGFVLCGISSILALIDFIKILIDKYNVDPNALF